MFIGSLLSIVTRFVYLICSWSESLHCIAYITNRVPAAGRCCSCGMLVARIDPVRGRGHARHAPVYGRRAQHKLMLIIMTQDIGDTGYRGHRVEGSELLKSATQQATMPRHAGARLNICRLVLAIVQTSITSMCTRAT
jgi:hypothetical protein